MKGITIGNLHTWRDLKLILASKTIGTPSPKVSTIDIPGGDGALDLTAYFGETKYNNRPISYVFSTVIPSSEFPALFSRVQGAFHGQKLRIVDDDDPAHYYLGRITVSEWKADKTIGKLTIDCDCEPYKYNVAETVVSATLDGTSNNIYDISMVQTVSTTIKALPDGFFEIDADNKSGAWQYITFFHNRFPAGEITPNQNVTIVMETKDFTVSGPVETRMFFTSVNEGQPDYFSPASFSTNLITHDRKTASLYPAPIKDEATIANAVYFIRSFIALANGSKCKGKFRMSILPGDVRPEGFVYASHDGTMRGLQLANGRKRVIPTILATSDFTLVFEGNSYTVTAGTTIIPEIELKEGINDIAVKGKGTITFTYREGNL